MSSRLSKWTWSDQAWLLAVIAADKSGDLAPLIDAFLGGRRVSRFARELIADFLQRHQVKKRRGGRARPIYELLSDDQVDVITAAMTYRTEGRRKGEKRDDAIKRLACDYRCHWRQLDNFLNKRGGIARQFARVSQP